MKKIAPIILVLLVFSLASCATAQIKQSTQQSEAAMQAPQHYTVQKLIVPDVPTLNTQLTLKPNPKKHYIMIRRDRSDYVLYYQITDKSEKIVDEGNWNSIEYHLDMDPFPAGTYYLKIYNFQNLQLNYRITKSE